MHHWARFVRCTGKKFAEETLKHHSLQSHSREEEKSKKWVETIENCQNFVKRCSDTLDQAWSGNDISAVARSSITPSRGVRR